MKIALTVSYDGTHFCGWQRQKNGRSVQQTLEEAAEKFFSSPVKIAGSGRTDAGVHALAQVCHLEGETTVPPEKLRECLNGVLPPDVRVLKSAKADGSFDCTRGAKRKTYRYTAYAAESELPLLERYAVRVKEPLCLEKMRACASLLEGEHDFMAFCAAGSSAKTSVRTVYAVTVEEKKSDGHTVYEITVCGNGFLYNMVRIMAGAILSVGSGRRTEEDVLLALQTGERTHLDRTMPAKGLTMVSVEYEVDPFL